MSLHLPAKKQVVESRAFNEKTKLLSLSPVPDNRVVVLENNLLSLKIDKLGGQVVEASLKKYDKSMNDNSPVNLINNKQGSAFIIKTGVLKDAGILYSSSFNAKDNSITLTSKNPAGVFITKRYALQPNKYDIILDVKVDNKSVSNFETRYYAQYDKQEVNENQGYSFERFLNAMRFNSFTGGHITPLKINTSKLANLK